VREHCLNPFHLALYGSDFIAASSTSIVSQPQTRRQWFGIRFLLIDFRINSSGLNLFPTKALAPEGFLLGSEIDYGTSLFNLVTNLNNDSNSLPLKLKLASILL
jgi:hypothetical protein